MVAKRLRLAEYNAKRIREGWNRIAELSDFPAFTNFVNYGGNVNHQRFGEHVMAQVKKAYPEVQKEAGPQAPQQGPITFYLDESASQKFVSLWKTTEDLVIVWTFANPPARTFRRSMGIVSDDGDPE